MKAFDALDERLVQLMEDNARQSSDALAKQLGVSPATVRRRIRKLVKNGTVRIAAIVDPARIGYPLAAVIALDVAHEKLETVLKMLSSRPEVKWVSTTTGRFDILLMARFRSTDELSDFMQKEMAKIKGIRNSETFICLHREKGFHAPI